VKVLIEPGGPEGAFEVRHGPGAGNRVRVPDERPLGSARTGLDLVGHQAGWPAVQPLIGRRAGPHRTVKALLDGARTSRNEAEGTTSLILAIINDHWELAAYLLTARRPKRTATQLHQLAWSRRLNSRGASSGLSRAVGHIDSSSSRRGCSTKREHQAR